MDEHLLRELCDQGQFEEVTLRLLRALGPELLGFIRARLRDPAASDDAYSEFCLDFWRSLPTFRGHCSFKAWAYTLARNASVREGARNITPRKREVGLSQLTPALEALVRTTRPTYLRSETENAFAALRAQLPEEEQTLLVLRVDKNLDWKDIAAVLLGESSEGDLDREANRLRQQFHALKLKLTDMARKAGLLEPKT